MIPVDAAGWPPQAPAGASLSVLSQPACTVARLRGELDIATAPALHERLLALLSLLSLLGTGARLLVIDLSGVSFSDAAGLAMLIGTQRRARGVGVVVHLAAPRPQMTRLLRVTGLDRSFTIHATHNGRPLTGG